MSAPASTRTLSAPRSSTASASRAWPPGACPTACTICSVGKGVHVQFNEDDTISIDLHIIVDNNVNLNAVGASIISEVRYVVTNCTGTEVRAVNVYIDSMVIG